MAQESSKNRRITLDVTDDLLRAVWLRRTKPEYAGMTQKDILIQAMEREFKPELDELEKRIKEIENDAAK